MNILLLRFSSLGDVILTMPVAKALQYIMSDASVDLGTKVEYKGLFTSSSPFKDVIYLGNDGFISFVKDVNKRNYDMIIDLHSSLRTILMLPLLNGKFKKRYKKGSIARRLFVTTGIKISDFPSVVQRYLSIINTIDIPQPPWFDLGIDERKRGEEVLKKAGVKNGKIVGLAPGAKWDTKKWNIEHYIELSRLLERNKLEAVFVFGKGDEQDLKKLYNKSLNLKVLKTDDFTLRDVAYAIATMDVFISGDSGFLHLAEASGTPLVALFGPTTREFGFFPVVKQSIVIEKPLTCRPCSLHGSNICKYGHHKCMEDISVDEVAEAVFSLLNERLKNDKLNMV